MKRTKNILTAEIVFSMILFLLTVILFETDFLDFKGFYTGLKQEEFVWQSAMELITIAVIPFSLKMVKIKRIKAYLTEDSSLAPKHLLKIGTFRILILSLSLWANTLLYYLYWQTTFGYMAIILFLCFFFVFPSSSRCESEISAEN